MIILSFRNLHIRNVAKPEIYPENNTSTFRYWRATVEFQETGQEVSVKILLDHKSTKYLWLYVQLSKIYFGGIPKYTHIWVITREEESKAYDDGYQFIRRDPTDGACLYGKKIVGSAAQLIGHD